jgi:hypothetical protein
MNMNSSPISQPMAEVLNCVSRLLDSSDGYPGYDFNSHHRRSWNITSTDSFYECFQLIGPPPEKWSDLNYVF